VELAALPGAGIAGGAQGGFEAGVGIGYDKVGNADAALFEGDEEFGPRNIFSVKSFKAFS
jgi:hypothetical protein